MHALFPAPGWPAIMDIILFTLHIQNFGLMARTPSNNKLVQQPKINTYPRLKQAADLDVKYIQLLQNEI
jgi:hypothetical protein